MMLVYANLHTSPNTPLCVVLASPTSKFSRILPKSRPCGLPGLPYLLVWDVLHARLEPMCAESDKRA